MTEQTQTDNGTQASLEEYSNFISQLELEGIWLQSCRITNNAKGEAPSRVEVNISSTSRWEASDRGFVVFDKYLAEFKRDRKRLARIEVQFGVSYASEAQMSESLFSLFADNNLPLNTWPYLREYLAASIARMQWLPFTLPTRRIGQDPVNAEFMEEVDS